MAAAANRPSMMWRIASLLGKSHLTPTSILLNSNAAAALHTSSSSSSSSSCLNSNPSLPNSNLLNLTRAEVAKLLSAKSKTGFDHVDDAHALFYRMLQFQPLPLGSDFNRLLTGVVKMKQFSSAVLVYREMRFKGVPIDSVVTMNIAIDCFCHLTQVDFGFSILATIFKLGFKPNEVTLNTLTRGLCNFGGRWKDVKSLMTEMVVNTRIYPNVVTFSILVDAFSKEGCVKEAEVMLRIMIEMDERPNVVTYTSLMDGYCMRGDMDRAHQVLQIMVAEGCQPNIHSYSILLKGFCRTGNVDDALDLLKVIFIKGMKGNVVTFNTIIHGLFEAGRCDDARKLIKEMQSQGVSPDNFTYCIWLDGLFQNGLVHEAHTLLCDLEKNNNVSLDIAPYNVVIKGLFKNGEPSSAKCMFDKLPSLGLEPNVKTFNTMMEGGLCQQGMLEDAKELLAKMRGCGRCYPPDTAMYNLIVH